MYFIWGHKATREVERDVSTGEGAGRDIPVDPTGWAPTTPKGTQGLSSPSDWSCSSRLRVSSLPGD